MGSQSVSVIVDVHERPAIRELLAGCGASVDVAALTVGDYHAGRALVERKTVNDLHRTPAAGRFFGQLARSKSSGPSATSEAALAAIPGVSTMSARALLERFGSLERIVAATDAELTDVYGIGPVRSQAIRAAITHRHAAYRSRRSRERPGPST